MNANNQRAAQAGSHAEKVASIPEQDGWEEGQKYLFGEQNLERVCSVVEKEQIERK